MGDEDDDGPPLTLKERKQRLELAAAASSSITAARSAPTPAAPTLAPAAPPPLPVRALSASSTTSSLSSATASRPPGARSPQPQWLPTKRVPTASPSRPDYALVQQYPPLSPTPSSVGSPSKSRASSPSGEPERRPRAGSSASVLSAHSASSSGGLGPVESRSRQGSRTWPPPPLDGRAASVGRQATSPTRVGGLGLGRIDTTLVKTDDDALISFSSPVLESDRGWGSANGDSPSWRLQPPTPSTPHQRPPSQERANSHPSPTSPTAPELPPRRRAATLSPDAPPPALPPRPRAVPSAPPPLHSPSPDKHRPTTSPTTARGRHSRHATPKEFESISLSSDGASSLAHSLSSLSSSPALRPPKLSPRPTPAPPLSPKRRPIDPRSKARYDKLFDRCVNALMAVPRPAWVKKDDEDALDALAVRGVWERSRLDRKTLSGIWRECDADGRGSLRRDDFAKGLWSIDEELRRRSRRLV